MAETILYNVAAILNFKIWFFGHVMEVYLVGFEGNESVKDQN